MITGLMALTGAAPALAAPAKPPAGKAPAKPAAPPPGKAPAKPAAKAPAAPKPMTEKQKKEAARKAYKDGEAKFKKGDYKAALEDYKVADELLPIPATKYKIGVCQDKLGHVVHAAAAYQAFLDAQPDEKKMGDAIADAKSRLDAIKKTPGKIRIGFEPAGLPKLMVTIDNGKPTPAAAMPQETVTPEVAPVPVTDPKAPPPPPPPPQPSYQASTATVPPGVHKVTATAEGYDPASADVDVHFARTKDLKLSLHKTPPPPPPPPPPEPVVKEPPAPPPPPPPPPRSNVPAYVTLGLAGAGLVVGGIFGGLALKAKSDFNNAAAAKPNKATTDMADKVDRNALISDMSFAVALTFGVTGAVLLLSNDSPAQENKAALHPTQKKTAVRGFFAPWVSPQGGGAAALVTF